MRAWLLRLEPVIWGLFGGGMFVGALLLPAWLLAAGVLAPLGLVAFEYETLRALATHPLGRLAFLAAAVLPPWAGAHQLRHICLDLGLLRYDGWIGAVLYVMALLISLTGAVFVLTL